MTMQGRDEIRCIINDNVSEITSHMTGITLIESQPVEIPDAYTIHLCAKGSYQFDLYLQTDIKTLAHIAGQMKRGPVTSEEIPMYATEFFNILGGHIVSKINRLYQQTARFKPPVFFSDDFRINEVQEDTLIFYYRYLDGGVKVEGQFSKSST